MQLFIYKSTEQAKVSPAISKEYSPTFQTIATAFIFLWNKNNKNMLKIIKPVEPYSYLDDWMIEHTSFCVTTKPVARYWVNWRLNTKKWDTLNKKKCWTKGSKRHLGWLVASFKEIPIVDHTFQQSQPPTKRELLPPFLQSSYKSMPPIPDPCSIPATWPPDPRIYFSPRVGVGHWWWEWQFWQVMQQGFHYTPTIHENWHISQNGFGWIFLCLICIGKYQSNGCCTDFTSDWIRRIGRFSDLLERGKPGGKLGEFHAEIFAPPPLPSHHCLQCETVIKRWSQAGKVDVFQWIIY